MDSGILPFICTTVSQKTFQKGSNAQRALDIGRQYVGAACIGSAYSGRPNAGYDLAFEDLRDRIRAVEANLGLF